MNPLRRSAFVAGALFIITFVARISAGLLYLPVIDHANYIVGPGVDYRIALGAFFER